MFPSYFKKTLCSVLAFSIGFTQTATNVALAKSVAENTPVTSSTTPTTPVNPIANVGKEANAFGKELGGKGVTNAPTFDGLNIGIKAGNSSYSINKDSLAPTPNGKNIKYAHTPEDFEKQKELWNDGGKMDEVGTTQKDELFTDSESDNPTIEGDVYALLVDMANKNRSDYTQEEFLKRTEEIMGDMENVLKDLVSCDANSALDTTSKTVHIEDLKQCQQVIDKSVACEVKHPYVAGIVEHSDGPFNLRSCGDDCTEIWIGRVGDNYWGGSCTIYEEWTQVLIHNPEAVMSATLTYAKWDDYMMVYVGEPGSEELVWTGPYDWRTNPNYFPPETPGKCELSTSWATNPGVDVTKYFRDSKPGVPINFKIRASVSGHGEAFGRINIRYDPSKVVSNDIWQPKGCVDAAIGVEDGFASGEFKCTEMPEMTSDGCAWVHGAKVCPEHLAESPIKGINKFCRKVKVETQYTFNKGDTGCWQAMIGFDSNGNPIYEQVCGGENLGGNLDTCVKYKDDPKCKFVESTCTEGMTGASGTCYVNDVVYDCGKDVVIEDTGAETTYDCKGITCLGEECIDAERTQNTNFGKISALLNAMQYMAQDMTCAGLDENGNPTGDQNVDCKVFGGTGGYCKVAVGGWQDCCEPVGGPGVAEYIAMILAAQRNHSATMNIANAVVNQTGPYPTIAKEMAGGYADAFGEVKNVLSSGLDWMQKAWGSAMDNLYTFTNYLPAPFQWFRDQVIQKVWEYGKEMLTKIIGKVIPNFGGMGSDAAMQTDYFQKALNNAVGDAAGNAIGSVITFVGWVYLAYQIADLVIKLVYKCEQDEYELVSKRETNGCHYVGSYCKDKKLGVCIVKHRVYCCYQSPLSRIINEQIKLTQPEILGANGDWGTPKAPKCDGIPLGDINKINWDLINLDEWTALLISTGNQLKPSEIDLEHLTGKKSLINWTSSQGNIDDWDVPQMDNMEIPNQQPAARTMSLDEVAELATASTNADVKSNAKTPQVRDRLDTIERLSARLNDVDVDGLRVKGAPCVSLEIGNGVVVRGGCGEASNLPLVCRKNGALYDCEEIAYQNSLNDLLGHKPTSKDWFDNGFRCTKDEVDIDCSTLYSKESYIKALEEYAKIIGGTTYLNRYVCLDKSNLFNKSICEHAMEQNYCYCLPGKFICQDGNKPIACSSLGVIKSDCACLDGVCKDNCAYGGVPNGMEDNPHHACSEGVCPYGSYKLDNSTVCDTKICPYGQ